MKILSGTTASVQPRSRHFFSAELASHAAGKGLASGKKFILSYFAEILLAPRARKERMGVMESLNLAREIYRTTAEEADGERLVVFTGELQRAADALEQPDEKEVGTLTEGVRSEVQEISVQGESSYETTSEAALHLRGAAKSLKQTMGEVNPHMKDLPGNRAGEAHLGQDGSEVVDPLTPLIEGGGQLIDSEWARAVAAHEEFHTEQKQPDVEVAGNSVTAHEFLEAGAIAAQLKVAPQSFSRLSLEYQVLYRKVLGLLPDGERVMELSREGKLKQFEKEVESEGDALAA